MTITSLNVEDGSIGRQILPSFKRRYILGGLLALAIILAALIIYFCTDQFKGPAPEELVPKNPVKALPPSASRLRIFKQAAVCADAPKCAEIGRFLQLVPKVIITIINDLRLLVKVFLRGIKFKFKILPTALLLVWEGLVNSLGRAKNIILSKFSLSSLSLVGASSQTNLYTIKFKNLCFRCDKLKWDILNKKGSAVDATLAAMLCNGVVTMQSMGLGGGFQMIIYKKDQKKVHFLNAREKAPEHAKIDSYKETKDSGQKGPISVGVPGELRGYKAAHDRFGKLPWKQIVEPTIKLCEEGYNMTAHQEFSLKRTKLFKDENLDKWFRDHNGNFRKAGSKIVPKALCETLKLIAEDGPEDFYTGRISKMFLEDLRERGGILTEKDLQDYKPEWKEPVSVTFRNGDVLHSIPPPGSGILLAFILNILDGYGFNSESLDGVNNTVLTYHRIIEAFKYAYARRTELGDTNFVNISQLLTNLTSKDYANQIRSRIKDDKTSNDPKDYGAVFLGNNDHGTAHISVMDEMGDAVSVTSSINIYFGAGFTSRQTGIIYNSVMDDFSFPFFKNFFGLPGSPNNQMEPGKRPLSSMSPTIILDKNDEVKMVVGAAGGTKITTSVALAIMRTLWLGESIKEAVDAPRIHHQLYPMEVEYEYGTLQQIVDGLSKLGHKMRRNSGSVVCALVKMADKIIANADYRKGGDVYGLPVS